MSKKIARRRASNLASLGSRASLKPPLPVSDPLSSLRFDVATTAPSAHVGLAQQITKSLAILESSPLISTDLDAFRSPWFDAATIFPSLFGGITQQLSKTLAALDSSPIISTQPLFDSVFHGIASGFQQLLESVVLPFPSLVHPKAQLAASLGWVVHHTLPAAVLDDVAEEDLDEAILTHYKHTWAEVRTAIEQDTSGYLVDQDSKDTMTQALSAHEQGLYRLVPRAMVTEIERATRIQLNEKIVEQGLDIKGTILAEVDDLPISSFHDISSGVIQYKALKNHLYKHINDENDRRQFAASPIPNRHATVHGLVPYASEKSSLNSIFLTDFVFLAITQIKKKKITEAAEILTRHVQAAASSGGGGGST